MDKDNQFPNFWQAFLYMYLMPLVVIPPILFVVVFIFKWVRFDSVVVLERAFQHVLTIPLLLFLLWKSGIKIQLSEFTHMRLKRVICVVLLTLISVFVFRGSILCCKELFQRDYPIFIMPDMRGGAVIHALIMAPVIEEVIYRRILLCQFMKQYSVRLAIILSALLFAFPHVSVFLYPELIIPYLISGIFLGIVYYKTNSLLLCIIAHVLMNLLEYLPPGYWPFFNRYSDSVVWII